MRLLLVEDNEINQVLAQRLIHKRGHKVVIASNGREALALLEIEYFDLVLMDIQMPEMSGLEVTAQIRRNEQATGQHIPIVATTASAMKEDRERCVQAGMDAYLSKPLERDSLFETIERLTGYSKKSVAPAASSGTSDPVFDRGAVLASLDGDSDLLREITGIFLAQAPRHMERIREAVSTKDPKNLERAAHALKGSAANLLAQEVVDAAAKLEEIGRLGSVAGSSEALQGLEKKLERLQSALGELEKEFARA